jgi:ComF family protein
MPLSGSNVTAACGNCQKHPPLYRATYSFAPYIPPLDRLIQQFKFQQKLHIGQLLGTMMAQDIALKKIPTPHILVPVPLHAKRLRQRGYNQALELAKPIAKAFNLQLDVAHCFRHKETTEQVGLSAKKRKSNIKDAFEITGDFRGKHVAIIDDVMTTGSTVNELSRQFLNVGAAHVDVWVCARAVL